MSETQFGISVYADSSDARRDTQQLINRLEQLEKQVDDVDRKQKRGTRTARNYGSAIGAAIAAETVRRAIVLGDAYNTLGVRIGQIAAEGTDAEELFDKLQRSANAVGINVNDAIDTFQRFTYARDALGATDDQLVAFNLTVQQLGALSGASTQAMSAGLLQLGQALTQPIVRMEEFNSLTENLPALVDQLAEGLGVSNQELIAMARNGELASADVFQALLDQGVEVDKMFEGLPDTSERALQETRTVIQREIAEAFDTEAVAEFVRGMNDLIAVFPEGVRAGAALVLEGTTDLATGIEEFFVVDVPKFILTGFQEGAKDAAIAWVNFTEGLKEQLADIPLIGDAISFDPQERQREIESIEAAHAEAMVKIENQFGPVERRYAALRAAAEENTKKYLDELNAAIEETNNGLDDIVNTDRNITPPRIDGQALQAAREEFIKAFGSPKEQIELEYDLAAREIESQLAKFIITEQEASEAMTRVADERNRALVEADIDAWDRRIEVALSKQQSLADLQGQEFISEFGNPLEQVESEFAAREALLRAYAEVYGLTNEELNERLRALDEERINAARVAEDEIWLARFEGAREGLDEYERIIRNLQDIDNEDKNIREQSQRETMDTMLGILQSGGEEAQRIAKGLAIAQATVDGVVAVQKAWASAPFPQNLPAVALVTAQTLSNIARIRGARAFGGSVQEGSPYYVGEAGGEVFSGRSGSQIFIPPENGTIRPVQAGGSNVQVNVIGAPENTRVESRPGAEGTEVIDIIIERTEGRLATRVMQGDGPLPRAFENSYGLTRRGE